jgi:hypothetical protein
MPVVIVLVVLTSLLVDTAEAQGKATTHLLARHGPMAFLHHPPVVTDYSAAMTHYRTLLSERATGNGLAGYFIAPAPNRWTWRAADGSTVRRVDNGVFRLTIGDCLSSLCIAIDCQDSGWPQFECRDGLTRKMAAPDFSTLIFDGVTYQRESPSR